MKDYSVKPPLTTSTDFTPTKKPPETPITDVPVVDPSKKPVGSKASFDKAKMDVIDKPSGSASTYSGTTLMEDLSTGPTKLGRIKTTDYGDVFRGIMDVLARDYLNDGSIKQMMGAGLTNMTALNQLEKGHRAIMADVGQNFGSLGRLMGKEITFEREPLKSEASLSKLQPVTLQKPLPPYWEFNSAANYASDSAARKKDATGKDKDVNGEAQKHRHLAVSLQVNGKMGKIQVDFQSMGVQTVKDDGTLSNATSESPTYEAVSPSENAQTSKSKLEKARFVNAKVEKKGDKYVMVVKSGCDVVKSQWDGKNMGPAGQGIVKGFIGMTVSVKGTAGTFHPTANDLLSVTRAYAEARHQNRMMVVDALKSNPELAPDLLKEMNQAAAITDPKKRQEALDKVFAKAEKDPRMANVGIELPETITLGRRDEKGEWTPMLGQDGKPVTISRSQMETLLGSQLVKNDAANDPSSTITDPPQTGSSVDDSNGAALGDDLTMTVTDKTGTQSTTKDIDLTEDVESPAEQDAGVKEIVSHTDSRDDVQVLQGNADNVDSGLQQAADQFSDGSLQIKDLSAQQQKQLGDALQNYLKVKDANAAKAFTDLLYSMMTKGNVGKFIEGVLNRLNASVRLNTAIDQLPPKLKIFASPSHNQPKDGLTLGGTSVPVGTKTLQGPPSVMTADAKTPGGAKTIFAGVIGTSLPKLQTTDKGGKALEERKAATDRLKQDLDTSVRLRQAAGTLGSDIADQLAAGKKPEEIADALAKELFPDEATRPKLTISLDGGQFHLTMETKSEDKITLLTHDRPAPKKDKTP
jgi:hypothetical protein